MDDLSNLLDGPRAHGAFMLRCLLEAPWSLRIQDEAPLTVVAMVRGEALVIFGEADPIRLGAGDVAIIRGPEPYSVADAVGTPSQVIIHPGQHCTAPSGESLAQHMDLGIRTWGNAAGGTTELITGSYQISGEVSHRLLAALPSVAVIDADRAPAALLSLITTEVVKDEPGQGAVLDRLLDLLLISSLRIWFADADSKAPSWYRALKDPLVGRALRLLHHHPAHPWTVSLLAAQLGLSRAALARRFTEQVGEPPMTYLTQWRLSTAADLLVDPRITLASVAREVGYGSAFALSAAFKRTRGISPQEFRAGRSGAWAETAS